MSVLFAHVPHEPGTPILDVRGLTVRYGERVALDDVSFSLTVGEQVAVVGPNGAGKSTLFKTVAGLMDPTAGEVRVFGHRPVGHICIAYVPQRSQVDWTFPATVADAVMMGRAGALGLLRRPGRSDHELVRACLDQVGLADLAGRQIGQLSGGQQQRMFIARALAMKAELMLMDEPLAALDLVSQEEVLGILDLLARRRVTVLVALHDLNLAAGRFSRALLLNHRLIGYGPPAEVFTQERLWAAYGTAARVMTTGQGAIYVGDTCCGGGHDHG
jgi:manganese/iron transport system ATP-binding protein